MNWPCFSINLLTDSERFARQSDSFAKLDVTLQRVSALRGRDVPRSVRDTIPGAANMEPGTFGCFVSHVQAWELLVASGQDGGVILEDDAVPTSAFATSLGKIKADREKILFLNDRMQPIGQSEDALLSVSVEDAILTRSERNQVACGGDGYFLTRGAAQAMIDVVAQKGVYNDVDWFVLLCALGREGTERIAANKTFHRKLSNLNAFYGLEGPLAAGRCLSRAVIKHPAGKSSRLSENKAFVAGRSKP